MSREPRALGSFGARADDRNRAERTGILASFREGRWALGSFGARRGNRNQVERGGTKRNGGFDRQGSQRWTGLELGSFGARALSLIGASSARALRVQ
jgi:hypothetical protein